jgi:predicted NAD/FAD-dependent oxidoreductase
MLSIAIIGAGSSALAAAHTLRDAGYAVTLFEQSSEVGGRATTRQRSGFIYDHGAQYIKQGHPASISLITERFRAPDLIDIQQPVWIFDRHNRIQPGDPAQNAEPKWCYRSGLLTLARLMASTLDIRLNTPISHVQRTPDGWQLFTATAQLPTIFDSLLITIPAPQAIPLIETSIMPGNLRTALISHLSHARYNPLISVMLGYQPAPKPRPFYALVNADKVHSVSWLAYEHAKSPERAPSGSGLLIAQMSSHYSQLHWRTPDAELIHDVASLVSSLLAESLSSPLFTDLQRWPYALPAATADSHALNSLTLPIGLAFCGDSFTGGRVHLALEDGIMVAEELIAQQAS